MSRRTTACSPAFAAAKVCLVLTGEIGTGKTTLCRAVLRNLGRKTYSSLVPDPFASREDLLKMLLIDFGVLSIQELTTGPLRQASRTELGYLLSEFLGSLAPDDFAVVIIDEAQNLSLPLIEETRILSDTFGADGRLQIVFVGQPELRAKLKLPEMRQVDQRVCGYHRLAPLNRDAAAGYIQHRLLVAGAPPRSRAVSAAGRRRPPSAIRRCAAVDQPGLRSRAATRVRAAGRGRGPGDPRYRADRGRLCHVVADLGRDLLLGSGHEPARGCGQGLTRAGGDIRPAATSVPAATSTPAATPAPAAAPPTTPWRWRRGSISTSRHEVDHWVEKDLAPQIRTLTSAQACLPPRRRSLSRVIRRLPRGARRGRRRKRAASPPTGQKTCAQRRTCRNSCARGSGGPRSPWPCSCWSMRAW